LGGKVANGSKLQTKGGSPKGIQRGRE